jgi:hypothetical protein
MHPRHLATAPRLSLSLALGKRGRTKKLGEERRRTYGERKRRKEKKKIGRKQNELFVFL